MNNYDAQGPVQSEFEYTQHNRFPLLNMILTFEQKAKTLIMLLDDQAVGGIEVVDGIEQLAGLDSLDQLVDGICAELKALGFISKTREYPADETDSSREIQILYSRGASRLNQHEKTYQRGDSVVGRSYGFPETATSAFPANSVSWEDLPEDIKNHPLSRALPFMPSRNHFREEWEWFLRQVEMANNTYPDLTEDLGFSNLF